MRHIERDVEDATGEADSRLLGKVKRTPIEETAAIMVDRLHVVADDDIALDEIDPVADRIDLDPVDEAVVVDGNIVIVVWKIVDD